MSAGLSYLLRQGATLPPPRCPADWTLVQRLMQEAADAIDHLDAELVETHAVMLRMMEDEGRVIKAAVAEELAKAQWEGPP